MVCFKSKIRYSQSRVVKARFIITCYYCYYYYSSTSWTGVRGMMEELHCIKYDFCLVHKCSLSTFSLEDLRPIGSLTLVRLLNFFALQFLHLWYEMLRWLARFVLALTRYDSMKWKVNIFGFGSFIRRTNIKNTQLIIMLLRVSFYSMEQIIWNKSFWKCCLIQVFSKNH